MELLIRENLRSFRCQILTTLCHLSPATLKRLDIPQKLMMQLIDCSKEFNQKLGVVVHKKP